MNRFARSIFLHCAGWLPLPAAPWPGTPRMQPAIPNKPVRIISRLPRGGSDFMGRLLAKQPSENSASRSSLRTNLVLAATSVPRSPSSRRGRLHADAHGRQLHGQPICLP